MKTAEYLRNVKPEWQAAFVRFVETGEAEEDFLNYLNSDEGAQQAVEAAFSAQAEAFQSMADEFKRNESSSESESGDSPLDCKPLIEGDMEKAVEEILLLSPARISPTQRFEVVHRTASALRASLRPEQQELLVETLTKAVRVVEKSSLRPTVSD